MNIGFLGSDSVRHLLKRVYVYNDPYSERFSGSIPSSFVKEWFIYKSVLLLLLLFDLTNMENTKLHTDDQMQ